MRVRFFPAFTLLLAVVFFGCTENPLDPATNMASEFDTVAKTTQEQACWGQATAVFAATGEMGSHASQQDEPRLGLRNLARALYDAGVIADDTMASLGQFVATELGLSIDACQ